MALRNTLSALCLALITFSGRASADCKNFTQAANQYTSGADYYTSIGPGTPQAISRGLVCNVPKSNYEFNSTQQRRCNASSECPLVAYGTVNVVGYNNLSLSIDQTKSIYSLIQKSTSYKPPFFAGQLSDEIQRSSTCFTTGRNMSGWFIFTPSYLCTEGTLSDCSDGPVKDGTAIAICAPGSFGTKDDVRADGAISVFNTDPETAAERTSNPAASASPIVKIIRNGERRSVVLNSDMKAAAVGFWLFVCLGLGADFTY